MADAPPFSAKSARLSLLLSPGDKLRIEQRAQELRMSVGEFLRRAADNYEPTLDQAALEALVDHWHREVIAMRDRLRTTIATVEENRREIVRLRTEAATQRSSQRMA